MADICDNYLFAKGPIIDLELFILNHLVTDADDGTGFLDLDSIIPYPETFRRMDAVHEEWERAPKGKSARRSSVEPRDGWSHGGRDWVLKHWGTKWTCNEQPGLLSYDFDEEPGLLTFIFDSAWSPISTEVMVELSRQYPETTFELRYAESEHTGRVRTHGGEILAETRRRQRWTGDMDSPRDLTTRRPVRGHHAADGPARIT